VQSVVVVSRKGSHLLIDNRTRQSGIPSQQGRNFLDVSPLSHSTLKTSQVD